MTNRYLFIPFMKGTGRAHTAVHSIRDLVSNIKRVRNFNTTEGEYDADESHAMMERIILFLRDLVDTLTVTLSIPLLLKKYSYIPSNKLNNDIKHLRKLCANYLDGSKEVSRDDAAMSKAKIIQSSFLEGLDSDLVAATEHIASCKGIAAELTLRGEYVSGEGLIVLRKFTRTVREFESNCILGKHPLLATMLVDRNEGPSTEIPTIPPERMATIKAKIKQKKAWTRQYIAGYSMAKHNAVEATMQRQFDDVHRRMNLLCSRKQPLSENLKSEKASLDKIYYQTLKANVETDRTLTRRKAKVLSQIESWVKKYDTDVAAKIFLLRDVTEQLEEQKIICRDLGLEEIPTIPPERMATIKAKIKQKKAWTRQYIAGYSMAKHNAVEATMQRQFDDVHRRMNLLCSRKQPLSENLKSEKASLDKIYYQTLKANVETDRTLTRRKAKVLSQIESWVKKYDTDVAAKIFLLRDVTEQLEEQKIICRDFYAEYDRLALEYAEVVAAQLEEERIAEEKAQMEAEAAAMAAKYAAKKGKKNKD